MVILCYESNLNKTNIGLITALGLYLGVERPGGCADPKLGISLISYLVIQDVNVFYILPGHIPLV